MKIKDSITVDGTITGTGSGITSLNGTNVSSGQVGAAYGGMPPGAIITFGGTSAPTGYLDCDGSAVSRSTYSALFSAIGTTWGSGNGTTTFNVPDLSRRVLMGSGGTGSATIANSVGSTGGAETHTLTTAEIPSHSHTMTWYFNQSGGVSYATRDSTNGTNTANQTGSTGGGGSHNNIQPSAIVKYVIKT